MIRPLLPGLLGLTLLGCTPAPDPASGDPEKETAVIETTDDSTATVVATVTPEEADRFVSEINAFWKRNMARLAAAQWMAQTHISDDTQLLAAEAIQEQLAFESGKAEEAKRFTDLEGLSADTARALRIVKLGSSMPAPSDAELRAELASISTRLEANYGSAQWCRPNADGQAECLKLQAISKILNNLELSNSAEEMELAWTEWRKTARPIREDYTRFAELMNIGARELGFADTGELWRGGYDMSPAEFEAEVERLWGQVEPLYELLHCAVRDKLNQKYGEAVVPETGPIPAHLLGNMWAQQWGNLYPLMAPHPEAGDLDINSVLRAQRDAHYRRLLTEFRGKPGPVDLAEMEHQANAEQAREMTGIAEDFYTSLGFPSLPDSFWDKSLLVEPRDRDVVCHASAWDTNLQGDVRIKQCIEPTEEELTTIHHELGHIYYYLMYNHLPPLFQAGAHDGFHEAIGDTITLSLTPAHLQKIGLIKNVQASEEAALNAQMKLALDKIVFLPWGKLVDQWRWDVFSGKTSPEDYNKAWWHLREKYQGVVAPAARSEQDFDPGAKFHIPGNTPYTRYFLAFILQFQFQKALCDAAGFDGPLHQCDIYGNAEAGQKLREMMALGASQPWPETLERLTGSNRMDASAIAEYFAPLMSYLSEQTQGKQCGWN